MTIIFVKGKLTANKVKGRNRQRKILQLLPGFPNGHNGYGLTRPMPGSRSFSQVFHTDAGAQALKSFSAAFPGALKRSWFPSGATRS